MTGHEPHTARAVRERGHTIAGRLQLAAESRARALGRLFRLPLAMANGYSDVDALLAIALLERS